jgi:periplasmic protein TonB
MMVLPARTEDRRFLLALGAAVVVHLALGVVLSVVPRGEPAAEREYQTIRVTLSPGAESVVGTNSALERLTESEKAPPPRDAVSEEPALPRKVDSAPAQPEAAAPPETPAQEPPAPEATTPTPEPTPLETVPEPAEPAAREAAEPVDASDTSVSNEPGRSEASLGQASLSKASAPTPYAVGAFGPARPPAANPSIGAGSPRSDPPTLEPSRYVAPEYPEQARRAGWTGTAVVELTIGRRGRVDAMELVESSGYAPLDEAAMRAVRLWRFPRTTSGERSLHRFEFKLE